MDVSTAIREITDREQIRELTHQYCFALDGGDLRELAGLFADSARLIIEYPERPVRQFEGRQAIYEFYRGFYQRVEILRHKVKNQIIELRGDQAVSRCYWDSINSAANTLSAGHYFDLAPLRAGMEVRRKAGADRLSDAFGPSLGQLVKRRRQLKRRPAAAPRL
jgi:hypothetical protein